MFETYKRTVRPEFDSRKGVYRITHESDRPWPVSTTAVLAISSVTGDEPTDMIPLATVVDPDVLNSHVQHNTGDAKLSFEYHGYDVTVRSDGLIEFDSPYGREMGSQEATHVDQSGA